MAQKTLVLLYPNAIAFEVMMAAELLHEHFPVVVATPDGAAHEASNGMLIQASLQFQDVIASEYRCVLVPGGDPYDMLTEGWADAILQAANQAGAIIGAICAGPAIITHSGIADGRRFTHGYGDTYREELAPYWRDARYELAPVVVDGNLVTAQAYAHIDFGVEMLRQALGIDDAHAQRLVSYYKGARGSEAAVGAGAV